MLEGTSCLDICLICDRLQAARSQDGLHIVALPCHAVIGEERLPSQGQENVAPASSTRISTEQLSNSLSLARLGSTHPLFDLQDNSDEIERVLLRLFT